MSSKFSKSSASEGYILDIIYIWCKLNGFYLTGMYLKLCQENEIYDSDIKCC